MRRADSRKPRRLAGRADGKIVSSVPLHNPMSKRIGVVTGGGDCPGLNAVIRAVAKAASKRGWECIGILGGYEGLLEPQRTISLDYQTHSGLLTRGGTILGARS